jgi:lipoprotein NlpD
MPSLRILILLTAVVLVAAGCSSKPRKSPTVEDRSIGRTTPPARPAQIPPGTEPVRGAADDPTKPLPPGQENAGQPGYYSVKPGDTLIRIGLDNGQNWRDIARWNRLDNPNLIEVGQVLRVAPPPAETVAVAVKPADSRPLPPSAAGSAASASAGKPGPATGAAPAAREGEAEIDWLWPASGPVISGFSEGRSKGLAIGGNVGDPVLAAADGRVVYAGSQLRGYGNLLIVKHNATYLTAYAHNQTLLVKEDQVVRRGQKIAEMGSSDSDKVALHFEIRKQGQPVDPAKLLPMR